MTPEDLGTLIGLLGCLTVIIICAMKGKGGLAALALIFSPPAVVGACRLAKPGSWWYENRYGFDKQRRAWERFECSPFVPAVA